MKHFGYGSNLNQDFLKKYCPSTKFLMKAYLPNYEVQFRYWSKKRRGGISSIIEKAGELVHGVIYDITSNELQELDILESVPQGVYSRDKFLVLGEDLEWHQADLYRVVNPQGPFTPSKTYVELMLEGAKQHQLDPIYVQKIQEIYYRSE
ncbi:gamma-glutamylcyclotransferase [Candidatus Bathyarchaeota archaeon]|nr:gamma-glutamylcyclotransferase [Candidatus Bathyarchaeota archaeon]